VTKPAKKHVSGKAAPVAKRLPAERRRAMMIDDAAAHFAEHGFESTTRDIAEALGVTQALIYKHFKSKEHLIEQTLDRIFGDGYENDAWVNADLPLADELLKFYLGFVGDSSGVRMRLFIRAGLDGRSLPTRRGHRLNSGLFTPVISALRVKAGLPAIEEIPVMRGERELVMALHASMVFLGIRRHIYRLPMPDNLDDVVRLYVTNFLGGAIDTIRRLHTEGEESLTIPIANPSSKSR
jgi:AcrR family transcriptional regulator